jgi:hypothetical protein
MHAAIAFSVRDGLAVKCVSRRASGARRVGVADESWRQRFSCAPSKRPVGALRADSVLGVKSQEVLSRN